jgi:hypothetical protein
MNMLRAALAIDSWQKLQRAVALLLAAAAFFAVVPLRVLLCLGGAPLLLVFVSRTLRCSVACLCQRCDRADLALR